MMSVRRPALALLALAAVVLGLHPVPPAVASATAEAVLVVDGKGDGHGVGLSQDGALAMGRAGATTDEILAQFYPGTELDTAGGVVGVRVLDSEATTLDVSFPGGGEVRVSPAGPQPDGFPLAIPPGGTATISLRAGTYRATSDDQEQTEAALGGFRLIAAEADPTTTSSTTAPTTTTTSRAEPTRTTTSTAAPATTTTTPSTAATSPAPAATSPARAPGASSADGLWLVPADGATTALPASGRRYRGTVEVGTSALGGIELVDHLDVEDYLRGMGEVLDPSWPEASLRAQAIAARTYALRAARTGTLCDDDRCQVYLGAGVEYGQMDEAVAATAGQVLTFGGGLASTVYSASGGGVTATPREGFGADGTDLPYLPAAPYPVSDPPAWTLSIALADLGSRLGYPGRVREATVSAAGPSGRVLDIALHGDAGDRTVDGLRFASRFGLDSTLFSIRTAVGTPSPAPGGEASIQAPPDAVAALPPLVPVAAARPAPGSPSTPGHAARSVLLLAAAACLVLQGRRRRVLRRSR